MLRVVSYQLAGFETSASHTAANRGDLDFQSARRRTSRHRTLNKNLEGQSSTCLRGCSAVPFWGWGVGCRA